MRNAELLNYGFHAKAPLRLSLAGGGTDVGTYPERFGAAVINCTITIFARVCVRFRLDQRIVVQDGSQREDFASLAELEASGRHQIVAAVLRNANSTGLGVELCIFSGTKPRSGLGGSAALFVALLSIFNHVIGEHRVDNYRLAELAWQLERDQLGNLGGRQDQYAAAFGGLNYLEFVQSGLVRVVPFNVSSDVLEHLESHLLLFFVGEREASGGIIEDQVRNAEIGTNLESLHETRHLAEEMRRAILRGDAEAVGQLVGAGWKAKNRFSAVVTTPRIDELNWRLLDAGMLGGKLTGAGGGGHFLAFADLMHRQRVLDAAAEMGATHVPVGLCHNGVTTWQVPRNGFVEPVPPGDSIYPGGRQPQKTA